MTTPAVPENSSGKPPRLYDVEEAAAILHVPRSWLYERTRRNAIPYHRLGKYVRFTEADLDAIITAAATLQAQN